MSKPEKKEGNYTIRHKYRDGELYLHNEDLLAHYKDVLAQGKRIKKRQKTALMRNRMHGFVFAMKDVVKLHASMDRWAKKWQWARKEEEGTAQKVFNVIAIGMLVIIVTTIIVAVLHYA